jgi:hypothetical protein
VFGKEDRGERDFIPALAAEMRGRVRRRAAILVPDAGRLCSQIDLLRGNRAVVIARDEIIPSVRRTWSQEPSLLGFHHHVENTNDQIDLRGGRPRRGSRILG